MSATTVIVLSLCLFVVVLVVAGALAEYWSDYEPFDWESDEERSGHE